MDETVEAKRIILDLIIDLRDNIFDREDEEEDLTNVEIYFKLLHPERVIDHVINHVLPHKKKIDKRDVNFFLKNKSLFAGLPEDKIKYYSTIIANGKRVSQEDRDVVWDYFDSLIALAESYRKRK